MVTVSPRLEVKNEAGIGGSEPSFQALHYYDQCVTSRGLHEDEHSFFPCFIVTVVGARFSISGTAIQRGSLPKLLLFRNGFPRPKQRSML